MQVLKLKLKISSTKKSIYQESKNTNRFESPNKFFGAHPRVIN